MRAMVRRLTRIVTHGRMCRYINTLRCVYIYMYTYVQARIYIYTWTYVYMYIHTYIHTYILTYIHTYLYVCVYIYAHIFIDIYIYVYIYTFYVVWSLKPLTSEVRKLLGLASGPITVAPKELPVETTTLPVGSYHSIV